MFKLCFIKAWCHVCTHIDKYIFIFHPCIHFLPVILIFLKYKAIAFVMWPSGSTSIVKCTLNWLSNNWPDLNQQVRVHLIIDLELRMVQDGSLFPADVQQMLPVKEGLPWTPGLDQQDPDPLHIKEEEVGQKSDRRDAQTISDSPLYFCLSRVFMYLMLCISMLKYCT